MFGLALIDKPTEMTSHDAVAILRGRLKTRKIGHAGTLDPNATGLLVMAVGAATRFLNYLDLEPKVYEGVICFGRETNTYDAEGEVVRECDPPSDLEAVLDQRLDEFRGEIEQLPPMYSAVKKAGKPLYVYARKGQEVERESRRVCVHELKVLELDPPRARMRFVVSGGTYVRSLAHDLGQAVGNCAYLHALRRTEIGEFSVEEAVHPKEIEPEDLISLSEGLSHLPTLKMNEGQEERVRHGNPIRSRRPLAPGPCVLLAPDGEVAAIGEAKGDSVQPSIVVPPEASP